MASSCRGSPEPGALVLRLRVMCDCSRICHSRPWIVEFSDRTPFSRTPLTLWFPAVPGVESSSGGGRRGGNTKVEMEASTNVGSLRHSRMTRFMRNLTMAKKTTSKSAIATDSNNHLSRFMRADLHHEVPMKRSHWEFVSTHTCSISKKSFSL